MPIKFNEPLDTVTPNVPTYTPEGGGGMLGGASNLIDSITETVTKYAENKAAERNQATLSGLVTSQLDEAERARQDVAEYDRKIAEQEASINPDDKETLARARKEIDRLRALKRQRGVDFTATMQANLKRDIAANPHLTEDLLTIYRSTGSAIKESIDLSQEFEDPSTKTAGAALLEKANEVAAQLGTTPEQALLVMQDDARLKNRIRADQLATLDGDKAKGSAVVMIGNMFQAGVRKLNIVAGRFKNVEQSEVFINGIIAEYSAAINEWRKNLVTNNIRLSDAADQEIRETTSRMFSMLRDYAKSYGSLNEKARTEVAKDPKFTTLMVNALSGGSPAFRMFLSENPEEAVKIVTNVQRTLGKLRGKSPDEIRAIEQQAAAGDADSQMILQAIRDGAALDLAASELGAPMSPAHINQAAQIVRLVDSGQTITGVMRPGTYAEAIGLGVVADRKDPKSINAILDKAEADANTLLKGGDVRNIDTVARLIDYAPYRQGLTEDKGRRASVIQLLQSNVIDVYNRNVGLGNINIDNNQAMSGQPTDKKMAVFSYNRFPNIPAAGVAGVSVRGQVGSANASVGKDVQLLNSSMRALKYYMKPADYKKWFEDTFGGAE